MYHLGFAGRHRLDFLGHFIDRDGSLVGGFLADATYKKHCSGKEAGKCQLGECLFHGELDGKQAGMLSAMSNEVSDPVQRRREKPDKEPMDTAAHWHDWAQSGV